MTVLALAPIGLDHDCWQWSQLEVDVIAHDLPGFGGREREPDHATMADWTRDVAASLEWTNAGPVDVVGCSLGGMVAQNLALARPDLIRSLVLACTGATADPETMVARAAQVEALGMEGVIGGTLRRWFTPEALAAVDHPGVEYARRTLRGLASGAFADGWRVIAGHDVRARLGEIKVPTTCVSGLRDAAAPLSRVQVLSDGIPGARLVTLPGAHMVQLEEPSSFASAVKEHLASVRDDLASGRKRRECTRPVRETARDRCADVGKRPCEGLE